MIIVTKAGSTPVLNAVSGVMLLGSGFLALLGVVVPRERPPSP